MIATVTDGRQIPGYYWTPLKLRRERRALVVKLALGSTTALAIALLIWFGAGWIAGLAADSQAKLFLTAIPSAAALIGLMWMLALVVIGEKRTPWG